MKYYLYKQRFLTIFQSLYMKSDIFYKIRNSQLTNRFYLVVSIIVLIPFIFCPFTACKVDLNLSLLIATKA